MPLIVRFLGQPYPGREIEIADSKAEIVFGRDPASDIAFPDDMAAVSRQHFVLKRELGGFKFRINREKPVFLSTGRPVLDDQDLPKSCEVRLGSMNGPRLVLERVEGPAVSNVVKTTVFSEGIHGAADLIQATGAKGRRNTGLIAAIGALALALAAGGWFWLSQTDAGAREAAAKAEAAKSAAAQAGTAAAGAIEALKKVEATLPDLTAQIENAGQGSDSYADLIAARKPSVYLVSIDAPGRDFRGGGTAFVVALPDGSKALATTAQVAAAYEKAANDPTMAGFTVTVVEGAGQHRRLAVTGVRIHPGYAAWESLRGDFRAQVESGAARDVSFVAAYDVALLFVDKPEELGPPLRLAAQATLETLDSGDPLFFIGFPFKNIVGFNPLKPEGTSQTGRVTANVSFFLSRAEPKDNQLIQHSLPTAEGAAGSPVFNEAGDVVAIHNAGNYAATIKDTNGNTVDIGSAAMVNYAQRADILAELIAGGAEAAMPARRAGWNAALAGLKKPLTDIFDATAFSWGRDNGDTGIMDAGRRVADLDGMMDTPQAGAGGRRTHAFAQTLPAGSYLILGGSEDGRTIQLVGVDGAGALLASSPKGHFVSGFTLTLAAETQLFVFAKDDVEGDPAADTRAPGKASLRILKTAKPGQG